MVDKVLFSSDLTTWETPHNLFEELNREFWFDVDVCASSENAKCNNYFDELADGLKQPWSLMYKTCWMNPPYNEPEQPCKLNCKKKRCRERGYHIDKYIPGAVDWVQKASEESKNGCTVVCLLPSRTDKKYFHRYIWDKHNHRPKPGVEVRFLQGRLKFVGAKDSAPFPSMIVIFRPDGR